MDEFIKKLIGRLEGKVHSYYKQYMDDIIGYSTYNEHKREITGIIEIVNQLAEEYKPNVNPDIQQWIDTKCDCGYEFSKHHGDGYYSIPYEKQTKYCPECGQKLDFAEEE